MRGGFTQYRKFGSTLPSGKVRIETNMGIVASQKPLGSTLPSGKVRIETRWSR